MSDLPAASVEGYAALARSKLGASLWQYLQDGDDDGNARALASWRVMPRPLADVRGGHTRCDLLGETLEHPLPLAPVAYQRLYHPDGEAAAVAAAAAQGGQVLVSSLASQPFQALAAASRQVEGRAPWLQLYWQGSRERTLRLIERAAAAGLSVVVFTIDAPIKQATLALPDDVYAVNLEHDDAHPSTTTGTSVVFDDWMMRAPTWDDVRWLREQTCGRTLLLKGILHPDDAARAVDCGCDGIVVSNHGGRVLDRAPASARMLTPIVERIAGRMPILYDGGVRSGADVFTALALGARAVLIGRPYVWGLAAHGAIGVAHVIRLLRDELEMTMALAGCVSLAAISAACLLAQAARET